MSRAASSQPWSTVCIRTVLQQEPLQLALGGAVTPALRREESAGFAQLRLNEPQNLRALGMRGIGCLPLAVHQQLLERRVVAQLVLHRHAPRAQPIEPQPEPADLRQYESGVCSAHRQLDAPKGSDLPDPQSQPRTPAKCASTDADMDTLNQ